MSLTIVGTVAYDGIETPFGKRERILGGAAMYAALSASYLTKSPRIISVVGDDFLAEDSQMLTAHGVDLAGIEHIAGGKCFYWAGFYHEFMNQRDTLVTELNVLADFDPKVPELYKNSDVLLLGNLSPDVQLKVLAQYDKKPKFVVMDTMNFWMNVAWDDLMKCIAKVDLLTINDEEAFLLTNEKNLVLAAEKVLQMGPKYVIIKKGEHGALLFGDGRMFSVPALPITKVLDPTGAGDSFAGGFVGYLDSVQKFDFDSLKNALFYATVMGSFNVGEFGPEGLMNLSKESVNKRVEQLKLYTQL